MISEQLVEAHSKDWQKEEIERDKRYRDTDETGMQSGKQDTNRKYTLPVALAQPEKRYVHVSSVMTFSGRQTHEHIKTERVHNKVAL